MVLVPMRAGALKPIVDRTGRESARYQFIREAWRNAAEAGATRVVFRPEWDAVERHGCYRLLIADDGAGMDQDEIASFMNTFGGGGKPIGDVHENFGMGVKTSMLPWNHEGLLVASRCEGATAVVKLRCDPTEGEHGEYGLERWEQEDEDGVYYDEILDLEIQDDDFELGPGLTAARVREAFLDPGHGTVLVALGMTGSENTFLATGEGGQFEEEGDIKGISKFLNERIWSLETTVEVDELRSTKRADWPRGASDAYGKQQTPDRRVNKRQIRGARHFLASGEYEHEKHGKVVLSDGSVVRWYLWPDDRERRMIHSYARRHGYVAVLYDNELYDLTDSAYRYRSFGIVHREIRRRLTLVVEPPRDDRAVGQEGVYPHGARSSLLWTGARGLPWSEWAEEFVDLLPREIREAIANAGSSDPRDPESSEWLEQILGKFRARFRRIRLVPKAGGTARARFTSTRGEKNRSRDGAGTGGGRRGAGSDSGDRSARRARRRSRTGEEAKERRVNEGLPRFHWTSEQELDEPGRAAVWVPQTATGESLVLLNREFPAFVELFQYWVSEYPPHLEDEVRQAIELVYGTEICAKVAHAHELKGHKDWTTEQIDRMLSPEALTLSALGLYACDQVINTVLGGKLGKKASRKASVA